MTLADNLKLFLPADAVAWLMILFDAVQVFDDVQDGDLVSAQDLSACVWNTLVAMPQNAFFAANSSHLLPAMGTAIMKWHAANALEKSGDHSAKSYVWRAGYYDIVLLCVILCRGAEFAQANAASILNLYGETFDDYLKEFGNA